MVLRKYIDILRAALGVVLVAGMASAALGDAFTVTKIERVAQ